MPKTATFRSGMAIPPLTKMIVGILFVMVICPSPGADSWEFETSYWEACLNTPFSDNDTLFEDLDLFNMRPICPVKEPVLGEVYIVFKRLNNQIKYKIVKWPDTSAEEYDNASLNGKIYSSFGYYDSGSDSHGANIFLKIYHPYILLDIHLCKNWVTHYQDWYVKGITGMDKDLNFFEFFPSSQWKLGSEINGESIHCFKKFSFEYLAHHTIFYEYNYCNYSAVASHSRSDDNDQYPFRKLMKSWEERTAITNFHVFDYYFKLMTGQEE